jgi:hypothetical protein
MFKRHTAVTFAIYVFTSVVHTIARIISSTFRAGFGIIIHEEVLLDLRRFESSLEGCRTS